MSQRCQQCCCSLQDIIILVTQYTSRSTRTPRTITAREREEEEQQEEEQEKQQQQQHDQINSKPVDIEYQGKEPNLAIMEYINVHKSGSLIAACIRVGAYLGGGSPRQIEALYQYGKSLGLLFQIVDDILDKEGYARIIGLSQTQEEAQRMHRRAIDSLKIFGSRGRVLSQMADFVLTRKY